MISIDYAMRVATQLQNEGKLEQAQLILNSILEIHTTHAQALHLSGVIAYQAGKIAIGIELIHQAIESNSSIALFHSNLGEMYRQLNNIELSIQCGERAVALDPNSATALSNLGIAYYDAGLYVQAEDYHKRALVIAPHLSASLNNMGSLAKKNGNTQQAIALYQAAIAASPHFVDALNNLASIFLAQQEFKKASDYLNQAILLAPTFADAHCNMGLALLGLNQHDNALICFEKALQQQPNYAESFYGLAKVYLRKHDFNLSEQFIRKAIAIKTQQAEFYQLLAEIYHEQGHHAHALHYLDHALAMNSDHVNLHISKGRILMETGEIQGAEDQFLKIAENPSVDTQILAHYSLVQFRKIQENSPSLKALLSIENTIQQASPDKLPYFYFALGKCYHDTGAWEKAFAYFSQGCNIKRKRITYNMTEQIEFTHKLIHSFTQETVEHLRAFATSSSLPIFIVGMPRSGTSLVEQILASHPDVYGAGELTYLTDLIPAGYPENIRQFSPENLRAITDNYILYLRRISANAIYITDKMPNNFIAIGLIHALFPHAKIIHVKRHPIDTCLSCYTKLFSDGQFFSYDLTELGQYYQCYEKIMNHWRHILPSDAFVEISYEDIIEDVESEAKRLIAYCDLSWDPACLAFYESKRQVRTASLMQVRKPVYTSSVNGWHRFEKELAPLINILKKTSPL